MRSFLALLLAALALGAPPPESRAVELDNSNYDEIVVRQNRAHIILLTGRRTCPECDAFEQGPWLEVLDALPELKAGVIDVDQQTGMNVAIDTGLLRYSLPSVSVMVDAMGFPRNVMAADHIRDAKQLIADLKMKTRLLPKAKDGYKALRS